MNQPFKGLKVRNRQFWLGPAVGTFFCRIGRTVWAKNRNKLRMGRHRSWKIGLMIN